MCQKCCLLLMCGLPASGKTTFAQKLSKKLLSPDVKTLGNCKTLTITNISYDDLIPAELEETLIRSEKWKDYRKAILNSIEDQITIYSKQYECCESQAPPELQEKFNRLILDTKESVTFDSGENDMLVFIIDDNMYYSGMRYEFYQLARKCSCSFAQVYIKCDVENAVRRNASRKNQVAEETIRQMARKLEPPDPSESWQCHSCTVPMGISQDMDRQIERVVGLVREALENPVTDQLAELQQLQCHSRQVTSESLIHQSDQALRKLVAHHMQQAKENKKTKEELQSLSRKLQEVKNCILQDLKSGHTDIVGLEICSYSTKDENILDKVLQSVFQMKLKTVAQ